MKSSIIQTSDGYGIHATLFEPQNSNGKLLLINSATGVKQQIYFSFSKFFADQGFTVITYDYRGIGLSKPHKMKGFQASMRIWGTLDYKCITDYIQTQYSNYKYYCVGHSVGALILGMNPDSTIFKKFIFVATQKAYVKNLNWATKSLAYFGFGLLQPMSSTLLGYFPAQFLGLGESLPKGTGYDWRTLILNPKSTNRLLEQVEDYSKQITQEVLMLRMEDDAWVTEKGVRTLFNETYPNAKPTFRIVKVSESEEGKIGHVNFFRSFNRKLWSIVLNDINEEIN